MKHGVIRLAPSELPQGIRGELGLTRIAVGLREVWIGIQFVRRISHHFGEDLDGLSVALHGNQAGAERERDLYRTRNLFPRLFQDPAHRREVMLLSVHTREVQIWIFALGSNLGGTPEMLDCFRVLVQ